jgi:hypothetical protein
MAGFAVAKRNDIVAQSGLSVALPQFRQQLAHPPRGSQLARNIGGEPQIPLRIEPTGLDVRRQLAHGLGESRKNLFDLACSEPSFPGHVRHLSGIFNGESSTAMPKYRACSDPSRDVEYR